jgi:hypothetical protein
LAPAGNWQGHVWNTVLAIILWLICQSRTEDFGRFHPIRVFNFVQTTAVNGRRLDTCEMSDTRRLAVRRMPMSKADQFRQYAQEDLRWARRSTIDKEKQALLELAHHWMLAALQSESTVVVNDSPPERRAP